PKQGREHTLKHPNFAQSLIHNCRCRQLESGRSHRSQMLIDNLATLTPKEEDIFNLYVQGCSTKDIISQLGITENTLKYHNKNIYSKLGVKTRKELLQYIELMRNAAH
ncbi:response regulator transcription factor, partial [Phascolarctobacterium succinatutens]|uniref:response regulator transcription factor n=1 Tax=Phascolarctobacterium succinatutens TaxID=626940 RepID=UPI0026F03265